METRCVRIKLRPDTLDKVHTWALEVNSRKSEAHAILKGETVSMEYAYLDEIAGEHYLVYFMKAENLSHPQKPDALIQGSLGAYHHQFKKECWESVHTLEQLIALDVTPN